ncbi:hypothetical protein [Litoribacter ruber]|uniref:hypothetical protein n=1 Tax=Litoribacter ruber TaxID=702568 RepID=UPI00293D8E07|nr:hypothetical protein [Litoribacter alkaliphilus]
MSYSIILTENFKTQVKKLNKKYNSLKSDLQKLGEELAINPTSGTPLGHNIYKIRLAITSKGKGKSGGARIITYVKVINKQIFFCFNI